jgi:hypothetical protein
MKSRFAALLLLSLSSPSRAAVPALSPLAELAALAPSGFIPAVPRAPGDGLDKTLAAVHRRIFDLQDKLRLLRLKPESAKAATLPRDLARLRGYFPEKAVADVSDGDLTLFGQELERGKFPTSPSFDAYRRLGDRTGSAETDAFLDAFYEEAAGQMPSDYENEECRPEDRRQCFALARTGLLVSYLRELGAGAEEVVTRAAELRALEDDLAEAQAMLKQLLAALKR